MYNPICSISSGQKSSKYWGNHQGSTPPLGIPSPHIHLALYCFFLYLSQLKLGGIALPVGLTLFVWGFGAYFGLLPFQDASPLFLVYGFPITIIGAALNYAELAPVVDYAQPEALAIRDAQATETQGKIRTDVCQYRYGDDQHLDEALNRLFQVGRPGGIRKPECPKLVGLREEARDGAYTLVLEFEAPKLGLEEFTKRQDKMETFFGPNIRADVVEMSSGMYEVALVRINL